MYSVQTPGDLGRVDLKSTKSRLRSRLQSRPRVDSESTHHGHSRLQESTFGVDTVKTRLRSRLPFHLNKQVKKSKIQNPKSKRKPKTKESTWSRYQHKRVDIYESTLVRRPHEVNTKSRRTDKVDSESNPESTRVDSESTQSRPRVD
jgi:hypothetical protein